MLQREPTAISLNASDLARFGRHGRGTGKARDMTAELRVLATLNPEAGIFQPSGGSENLLVGGSVSSAIVQPSSSVGDNHSPPTSHAAPHKGPNRSRLVNDTSHFSLVTSLGAAENQLRQAEPLYRQSYLARHTGLDVATAASVTRPLRWELSPLDQLAHDLGKLATNAEPDVGTQPSTSKQVSSHLEQVPSYLCRDTESLAMISVSTVNAARPEIVARDHEGQPTRTTTTPHQIGLLSIPIADEAGSRLRQPQGQSIVAESWPDDSPVRQVHRVTHSHGSVENDLAGHIDAITDSRRTLLARRQGSSLDVTPPGEGRWERYLDSSDI